MLKKFLLRYQKANKNRIKPEHPGPSWSKRLRPIRGLRPFATIVNSAAGMFQLLLFSGVGMFN